MKENSEKSKENDNFCQSFSQFFEISTISGISFCETQKDQHFLQLLVHFLNILEILYNL